MRSRLVVLIAAFVGGMLANPARAQESADAPVVQARPAATAPVVLGRDTIFTVLTGVGAFSATERADAVRRRLRELARDPYARLDSIGVRADTAGAHVLVGGRTVFVVTEADALAARLPRDSLAVNYGRAIARVLQAQGLTARLRTIAVGVLFALLTAIATVFAFRLVNRFFPQATAAIERGRGTWMPSIRIQKLELLRAEQLAGALLTLLGILRVVVLAGLLYLTVPVILSFFPWTRRYSDDLFGYILTPFAVIWGGLLDYLPKLFALGAIGLVTYYLLRLIRAVFLGVARETITFGGFYPEWAIPTYKLVRVLVLIFAFIAAWPYLPGSGSAAFQGVGVLVGLLISLGSAAAVGNMVGGIVLTYMRPFRIGDRVRIADTEGDVIEKTLLVTRVRTAKNVEITVPNAMVLGSHIVNYSASAKSGGLMLHTKVTIGYDVPWRRVHELLIAAARSVPDVLQEPAPFVLQTALSDYYPTYELNAYTDRPNEMATLYARLHEAIQDRFDEAGVEILSPAYTAYRDGNATTLPHRAGAGPPPA